MYAVVLEPPAVIQRPELIRALEADGIECRTFFCPMNQQPFLREQKGFRSVACPVADRLWEDGLYLPSSPRLSEVQLTAIATSMRRALA
jgi:perosamine synthetase